MSPQQIVEYLEILTQMKDVSPLRFVRSLLFDGLPQYFHAEGNGVSMSMLNKQIERLMELSEMRKRDTAFLIRRYFQIKPEDNELVDDVDNPASKEIAEVLSELRKRRETDRFANAVIVQEVEQPSEIAAVKKRFQLANSELVLFESSAMIGSRSGKICLSSNFVCFDDGDPNKQILMMWKEIKSISKEKFALLIPALKIDTANESFVFYKLSNRDLIATIITEQTSRGGNPVAH